MCLIRIDQIPQGSAPRHVRKGLVDLVLDGREKLPRKAVPDLIPSESNEASYFVPMKKVVRALRNQGRVTAAIYYDSLAEGIGRPRMTHLQIHITDCVPAG